MGVATLNQQRQRAVFLDRDGVIIKALVRNGKPYPPSTLEEVVIPEGVDDALERLSQAGFILVGITNQPDVARGTQKREVVELINNLLVSKLPILEFKVCYHDDNDHCECRKPNPGLLLQAAYENQIELTSSFMVGDRWKDIEAGRRAGCVSIWIDRGYIEQKPNLPNAYRVNSLSGAVEIILQSLI